ncbi:MAG: helix-turn-helix domain-containing protein [Blautia sp.]
MADPLLTFIATRIYNLRVVKGKSARELSLALGQNPNYINLIESEKNYPSIQSLNYICNYFNISLKDFFDEDNRTPLILNESLVELRKLDNEYLELFTKLAKKINNE